ncbi:hypothetical protein FVEG_15016 [Fusarium verticillioides 7600]|uniref:Secreted protein n=1 Tax=Gibberella moniliformis (strain M3125 / FGSC 7600) TaxID=334819 RepID=W7LJE6_GIBM7|nr:hypothetical protein FVEG_15016 [Fusarium verticillioides 7600]EWG39493.1 hypothetical protein FVEG_15016 [Fusarium verticillioides 7600]
MRVNFVTALLLNLWIIRFGDSREPVFRILRISLRSWRLSITGHTKFFANHRACGCHQNRPGLMNMGRDPDFCRYLGACRLFVWTKGLDPLSVCSWGVRRQRIRVL